MTPEQMADLPRLLEQATPGPWERNGMTGPAPIMNGSLHRIKIDGFDAVFAAGWLNEPDNALQAEADVDLIALAPTLARHVLTQQAQIAALAEDAARAHDLALKNEAMRVALINLAHEMRFLLRNKPSFDGGLYRKRLNEADAVLSGTVQPLDTHASTAAILSARDSIPEGE